MRAIRFAVCGVVMLGLSAIVARAQAGRGAPPAPSTRRRHCLARAGAHRQVRRLAGGQHRRRVQGDGREEARDVAHPRGWRVQLQRAA